MFLNLKARVLKYYPKAEIIRKRLRKKSVKITFPEEIMQRIVHANGYVYAKETHGVRFAERNNIRSQYTDEQNF